MDYDFEELKKRYESLPDDIKDAISSTDVSTIIDELAGDYGLNIEQSGVLYDEIGSAMLGITKPDDFSSRLSVQLKIPAEKSKLLVQDVNEEIFEPIRKSMMKESEGVSENDDQKKDLPEKEVAHQTSERDEILHDIENPEPAPARPPITDPERELETKAATEDFVAAKIATPPASPAPQNPDLPAGEAGKKYPADPYREPLN